MKITDENSPFTTHEIEFLKKIDEYDTIMAGLQLIEDIKNYPKDLSTFLDKAKKIIPEDSNTALKVFEQLEKDDPEFLEELFAFFGVMATIKPQEKKVEKVSIKQMQEQERAETYEILVKKLKSI